MIPDVGEPEVPRTGALGAVSEEKGILALTSPPILDIPAPRPVRFRSFGGVELAKPEWGIKRVCQSCATLFYDFEKSPIICPRCGTPFDPEAVLKSRRNRVPVAEDTAPARAKPKSEDDPDLDDEDEDEDDVLDDEDEDEDDEILPDLDDEDDPDTALSKQSPDVDGDEDDVDEDEGDDLDDDSLLDDDPDLDEDEDEEEET